MGDNKAREIGSRMTMRSRICTFFVIIGVTFALCFIITGAPAIVPVSFIVTVLMAWEFGLLASVSWVVFGHFVVPSVLTLAGTGPFYVFPEGRGFVSLMIASSAVAETAMAYVTVRLRSLTEQLHGSKQALLQANDQLQNALDEVKELRGLLPICSWCKNIRDDSGNWEKLESYLSRNSRVTFTHGLCPKCLDEQLYSATK